MSAVNSSRQLELLDLAGAAAYEAGIDRKANQARIMPRGRPYPRRCMRKWRASTYAFQLALSRRRDRVPCVVELAALVAVLSGMGRADRIGSVCVVSAELTRLKVMAPQARIRGAVVRALQLMQQRVSLMAKRAALNQSLASAARQAVAQRDHPDALGWQWQVTAYMAVAGDRLCGEHAWP
ncbi:MULTISPECIES: hypothetical protein [unclassified Mesorhizobium]|uniref:hypothetical protein n=1 Tax=unclassified Mesorhizobium TaxID=325217 RepID=UPI0018EA84F1|nr:MULTISPECIES: hypothetical protein [unclassified Mesorhizobium]